ncbi:MAG: hypothetical protein WD988_03035 [Candidatus Curtissbacteria bacterium]
MNEFPSNHSREFHERIHQRPLGALSDFDIERMPASLAEIRAGTSTTKSLVGDVGTMIAGLSPQTVNDALADQRARDIAGLDLKMLDAAVAHSEGEVPVVLQFLVDIFAVRSGQPGGISYEEIVLINPPSDRRLFTVGEVGKTEEAFYEMHRVVEGHLDSAIDATTQSIERLSLDGATAANDVVSQLQQTQEDLNSVIEGVHAVGTQNREHFGIFRAYLNSHPTRGTKGPSGAFTAGIPTIELLLAGEQLPDEYRHYIDENNIYFSRKGRKDLERAREFASKGMTLTAISQHLENPPLLAENINSLSDLMRRFRGEHYKTARNQVPEAIAGSVAGTGGETNPGFFLRGRMKIRHIKGEQYGE